MTDPDDRLESWKKIAAYLKRDVRTVQRWEVTNGMPVHRHQRPHRPLPYAYKQELDAWWARSQADPALTQATQATQAGITPRRRRIFIASLCVVFALIVGFSAYRLVKRVEVPPKSVGVLAFVDLSENMANEEFADGISEELIDRLHRIPGLKVPAPTSTFFFKYKQVPVDEIGRSLGVAYLVDGSVRKSGEQLRVSARLIRAADSTVLWSETYDRSWSDMLAVQDDIAGEVTRALERSIASNN
jgi:TolB-like protein